MFMKRIFLDTEFIESGYGKPIYPISIGMVDDAGNEYYGINADCPMHLADDWVKENVIKKLPPKTDPAWRTVAELRKEILEFVGDDPNDVIAFWAYFADYDWVVLCSLIGKMIDLPSRWPKFCYDFKQLVSEVGYPKEMFPPDPDEEHCAIADARWLKLAFHAVLPGVRAVGNIGYLNV
jgi:hypothetical protein